MTQAASEIRRKQLHFRATHRGFKEADAILGAFAALHLAELDEGELEVFAALLEVPDCELYDWLRGAAPVPSLHDTPVFARLRAICERKRPTWSA
ncbi:MAG TPA: succinate dehydrogenase assembly factor 2 [Rhizomicrobium sp.]|nr:succinate dehydrogenase assembly factor 2 [Rhizomicrobium sp.]